MTLNEAASCWRVCVVGRLSTCSLTVWLCFAVFEIILSYLEKASWQEAFFTVLPQRKGAVPVDQDPRTAGEDHEEDHEEEREEEREEEHEEEHESDSGPDAEQTTELHPEVLS